MIKVTQTSICTKQISKSQANYRKIYSTLQSSPDDLFLSVLHLCRVVTVLLSRSSHFYFFSLPPQIVENSVCTLRNLSYRLEVEMPSSRLLGNQELDTLLGFSSPAKELDYLCWGKRRRGRKRGGWPDDKVQTQRAGLP